MALYRRRICCPSLRIPVCNTATTTFIYVTLTIIHESNYTHPYKFLPVQSSKLDSWVSCNGVVSKSLNYLNKSSRRRTRKTYLGFEEIDYVAIFVRRNMYSEKHVVYHVDISMIYAWSKMGAVALVQLKHWALLQIRNVKHRHTSSYISLVSF